MPKETKHCKNNGISRKHLPVKDTMTRNTRKDIPQFIPIAMKMTPLIYLKMTQYIILHPHIYCGYPRHWFTYQISVQSTLNITQSMTLKQ